jgi:glutamate synthase domain-containing protein 2
VAFTYFTLWLLRVIIKKVFTSTLKVLMTDLYEENLLELFSASKRMGIQLLAEIELRAETGKVIERPLGSTKRLPGLEGIMFDLAQLRVLPIEQTVQVDTKVLIGPKAKKPLQLDIPIMIGGMAYGLALSEKAKIALAMGASLAGTSTNSGSGPFLQTERDNADKWILQYSRSSWAKNEDVLSQADAIEIQFGQGSLGGLGYSLRADKIGPALKQAFSIAFDQDAKVTARFPEVQKPEDVPAFVHSIRAKVDGTPIGIKIGCGKYLEQDLAVALQAGVDFITLSGAQTATHGSPPSIGETHGLPTFFALIRAVNFLNQNNAKDRVSLIVGGGLTEPGEILKALGLGADAVHIGTAALFSISHNQVEKPFPFEPPTQLIWYGGKYADQYDENLGAQYLANFLKSVVDEISDGVRIMGKTSIRQVTKADMFSLDQATADITGIPVGFKPEEPSSIINESL